MIHQPQYFTLFPYTTLFRSVVMITGDARAVASAVADQLGIEEVFAGVRPEDKAAAVSQLQAQGKKVAMRSEEHTSELQSRGHIVCRLLLEKKKGKQM